MIRLNSLLKLKLDKDMLELLINKRRNNANKSREASNLWPHEPLLNFEVTLIAVKAASEIHTLNLFEV